MPNPSSLSWRFLIGLPFKVVFGVKVSAEYFTFDLDFFFLRPLEQDFSVFYKDPPLNTPQLAVGMKAVVCRRQTIWYHKRKWFQQNVPDILSMI